jgi:hypothetical protein
MNAEWKRSRIAAETRAHEAIHHRKSSINSVSKAWPTGAALLMVAMFMSLSLASSASATVTRLAEPFSPITGAGIGLSFHSPWAIAVDESTGNVFASDGPELGGNGIMILGPEGSTPVGVKSPYVVSGTNTDFFPGNNTAFLAFDNSPSSPAKGTLYAYDISAELIRKYTRNAATEEYEAAGTLPAGGCGNAAGGGIDATGRVYFGCDAEKKVLVFSPTGEKLHEYNLGGVRQIAVDAAGDLFIQAGFALYKYPANGQGEIDPSNSTLVTESQVGGVAYEPTANEIVVSELGELEEFDATTLAKIGEFGSEALTYEVGGSLQHASPLGVALNPKTRRVYTVAEIPERGQELIAFGPEILTPTVHAFTASSVTGTRAVLNGSVSLEGIAGTECKFEFGLTESYGKSVPCAQSIPADSEQHPVSAELQNLTPEGTTYHYRLVAANTNGPEATSDRTFVTASTVLTDPATGIATSSATLNGVARSEGSQLSECRFEWGVTTQAGFEHVATECAPAAAAIDPDFAAHAVSAALAGLRPSTAYKFRLVTNGAAGTVRGAVHTFTTSGGPQIFEVRARSATQNSVVLEAKIDPNGFPTSYRFEWGAASNYGSVVPADFEPVLAGGSEPVTVTATVSGLSAATAYHYRVVAKNSAEGASTSASADHEFETVNSCGLSGGRCLEMVSPPGPRVAALPLKQFSPLELTSQAGEAPGRVAFETEFGYQGTAVGGESLYLSHLGSAGWQSTQYTPPATGSVPDGHLKSRVMGLSADFDCGVIASSLPLTADPSGLVFERVGGSNLYRRGSEGDYTLITSLPPDPLVASGGAPYEYELAGMSQDCGRVVFSTERTYPGVPGAGKIRLYEWNGGVLKNVGWVPDGAGEAAAEVTLGGSGQELEGNHFNAVSTEADRVFFTATSQTGNDAENSAVFARIDGSETLDVSQSPLAPDTEAQFQGATPDGSRVYFTANAGLTAKSSPSGRDLYECHIVENDGTGKHECELTDLSVGTAEEPAEAGAVIGSRANGTHQIGALVGVSDDGSRVYFVGGGQLIPGEGASAAQNTADGTLSLYLYEATTKSVRYVGAIGSGSKTISFEASFVTTEVTRNYTSRTSADGRYLLFESTGNVTGYDSDHAPVAYLFDAEATNEEEALSCVSCRQDGKPGVGASDPEYRPALKVAAGQYAPHLSQSLVVRNGRPVVFFRSRDPLAPGATEGEWSLYEWAHGQVFEVAADLGRGGSAAPAGNDESLQFIGASSEGVDLYFVAATALNWEDADGRKAVWDARVGGGFAQPAPVPACAASSEGSCQGSTPLVPSIAGAPASAAFSGPGNLAGAPPPPAAVTLSAAQIRARHLAQALRTCRKAKKKSRRLSCERDAHRKYGPKPKPKPTAKAKAKRTGDK